MLFLLSKLRMLGPVFEPGIVALRGQINDNSPLIDEKQIDYDRFAQYLVSIGLHQDANGFERWPPNSSLDRLIYTTNIDS
jgi:hypothetical protein